MRADPGPAHGWRAVPAGSPDCPALGIAAPRCCATPPDGARPWWDAILVVEYPSPQAFVDMVRDPAYQKVHEHRAAALEQGDLVATSQWLAG